MSAYDVTLDAPPPARGNLISLSSLVAPAAAREGSILQRIFNPPAGVQLTTEKPRNALQLRTGKVRLDARYMRQVVPYRSAEAPGTIVVNTGEKFLYLVLGQGKALRYGIGTARSGFEWSGTHRSPTNASGRAGRRPPR